MDNEIQDYFEPQSFDGAMKGARVGLGHYGIEADDEICTQVAVAVLTGFVVTGGLEPESLERLRDIVLRAAAAHLES